MEEIRQRRRPRGSASGGGAGRRWPSSRAAGAALRRKVRELRRLVPGGEEAPAGALLARTAGYIARLRARLELLRALAAVYGVVAAGRADAGAGECMS
ncbi:hypothetical protein C2845_PM14G11290 [Panicum miliaceum]|uniref:BHLH domain-containing protein n=1 Tax=Panicum miliaceum TaxID=4540 RepID=A0A3L6PLK7_PANMI|nr:hypothetical protein C2845_PM14G11290 [Panicum miliaceum]